jgi:16S rRNA C1402 (ribose-2'-O) methylase RsmI
VRVNERLAHHLLAGLDVQGFTLLDARIADDDRSFTYTFAPDVRILVEPRHDGPCFAQTRCFNLTMHQADDAQPVTPQVPGLLNAIATAIRAAEPDAVVWSRAPSLYLIPGTITDDPCDLSLRAVELLRQVPIIVVEGGHTVDTRRLLAAHGIDSSQKHILEVPSAPVFDMSIFSGIVDRMLAEDEDACLFGACEGVPGFCDPGKALIVAAEARGVRVRSVPGPSALAMMLMRLPFNVDAFTFLGAPYDPAPELYRTVLSSKRPVAAFVTYNRASVIARTVELCLPSGVEVLVVADLCDQSESVVAFRPEEPRPALKLLEKSRVVLVVRRVPWRRWSHMVARTISRAMALVRLRLCGRRKDNSANELRPSNGTMSA